MSVLARRMARAFYYFNRAKPDMRKSNAVRFPNEHGSYLPIAVSHIYEQKAYAKADAKVRSTVLRMNVRYVAAFSEWHGSYLHIPFSLIMC